MNSLKINTLKILRKIYLKVFNSESLSPPDCEKDPDKVSQLIFNKLILDQPCMIARFGSTELLTLVNYLGVKYPNKSILHYIRGKSLPWWWNEGTFEQMQCWSGFFPPTQEKIEQFCQLMIEDIPLVDVLGSWLKDEIFFKKFLNQSYRVRFILLEPFWATNPWTKALEGKKVLVVHPFAKTIEKQYKKRELLFPNQLLPEFELKTIKAVQSIAGEKTPFNDWFDALEYMKAEIDKHEYDICLIGCGAYGFPLAAHVKRKGKKSIHLGGSLQLLFGIRGNRWEDEKYNENFIYTKLINSHWVKPSEEEKPQSASKVENACYW